MRNQNYALRRLGLIVLAILAVAITSCGGGGGGAGMPAPPSSNPDPNPNAAVSQYAFPDAQGRLIDTESNYEDGSRNTIGKHEEVNIATQLFARDIRHGNQRGRLEITNATTDEDGSPMINDVQGRFIATMDGKNIANAGNSRFVINFDGQDIAELAPNGDWVAVTVGYEVQDSWFGKMLLQLNDLRPDPAKPTPQPDSDGDGNNEWRAIGTFIGAIAILANIFPCPDDYETYYFRVQPDGGTGGDTSFDLSGPSSANPGQVVTINVTSNCPEGWTVTWQGGSKSGHGNGTISYTMTNVVVSFMGDDNCGNDDDLTITPNQQNASLEVILTASPYSGTAPLTSQFTATVTGTGHVSKYDWDFDGNGSYELQTTTNTTQHTFSNVGSYVVTVRVMDDQGLMDTDNVTITVTSGGQPTTMSLFVAGTKGPLNNGDVWQVDETGSLIVDVWELRDKSSSWARIAQMLSPFNWGKQTSSTVALSRANVMVDNGALPDWTFQNFIVSGEIMTVLWSEPNDPDVADPGNKFIEPGSYPIHFSISYNGQTYTRDWTLQIMDRPDFP